MTNLEKFILREINDSIDNGDIPSLSEDLKLELVDKIIGDWYLWEVYNEIVSQICDEFLKEKGISIDGYTINPIYFDIDNII